MKLSISNIAWPVEYDEHMYAYLQEQGYSGLEIAPTRLFSEKPYEYIDEARSFAALLLGRCNLTVSSMQSIWYGRTESIFGSDNDRRTLIRYTKQAIDFAHAMNCGNLVFGCPKNRNIPDDCKDYLQIAVEFFTKIADYAEKHGTVIALEPNPPVYNTNFVNRTAEAFELCRLINKAGLKVNVDLGTLIYYGEDLSLVADTIALVNHIHISEPNLVPIEKRGLHAELRELDYKGFVSIEMKTQESIETVKQAVEYVGELLI